MWAPWHLPHAKAREFAYVGDTFSGKDMARMGWANYAVPADQLDDFTERFAAAHGAHRQRHARCTASGR